MDGYILPKLPPSLESLPEVFVSSKETSSAVSKAVQSKRLRKLGSRLYTKNMTEAPPNIVKRHWYGLLKDYFPDALISDRTALENRPAVDGSVFIISSAQRPLSLPGITFRPRKGHPPLPSDPSFLGEPRETVDVDLTLGDRAANELSLAQGLELA